MRDERSMTKSGTDAPSNGRAGEGDDVPAGSSDMLGMLRPMLAPFRGSANQR